MDANKWPGWRYGPNGQSQIFQSEADVPAGWHDHPSKVEQAAGAETGTRTAVESANGPKASEADAARTTAPTSQTHTDPAISAASGVGGAGSTTERPAPPIDPPAPPAPEIDAHGHPWSADLHAASRSKTTAGLWRMKVGVSRPAPAPGYPLDL